MLGAATVTNGSKQSSDGFSQFMAPELGVGPIKSEISELPTKQKSVGKPFRSLKMASDKLEAPCPPVEREAAEDVTVADDLLHRP